MDCNNQYFNNFSFQNSSTIKELSKNRIGILLNINSLLIYNSKTFNKISEIKINNSDDNSNDNDNENLRIKNMMMLKSKEEIVINFIELKNFDLVFWTFKKIFFYKPSEKGYILYQTIDESDEKPTNNYNYFHYYGRSNNNRDVYTINSIYQLKNDNLITCYTYGIKIYTKKNDNYILVSKHEADIEVKNLIEIAPNKLVLMQKNFESGGFCSQTYYCIHTYSLSLYDIETGILKNLNTFKEDVSLNYNNITFFNNDKYLFIKYGEFKFDVYDINQNMQSINSNNEIIEIKHEREFYNFFRERNYNKIKDEMNIRFICKYSEDLFFAKDVNNDIKLYKFKDKSFEFYQDFSFSTKEIIGMIKLKNNNLIIYSKKDAFIINDY